MITRSWKRAAAVFLLLAAGETSVLAGENPSSALSPQASAVLKNIMTRTSIRAYQTKPVESATETLLLKAAMAAPSAANRQPWVFVVIREAAVKDALAAKLRNAGMIEDAPLAILICGDMNRRLKKDASEYWVQDVSAATENLLLAAHALELGAVWCGVYPVQQRVTDVRSILQLPEHIVPLSLISIGYPGENPTPKNKWNPALIHYNCW